MKRRGAPTTPGQDQSPKVEGFTELTRIGKGTFSVVYRARQTSVGRYVALKILTVDLSGPGVSEQFKAECQATVAVRHPNIVTVHDAGMGRGGRAWLAMELFEGGSLADEILQRGPTAVDEVLRIGIKVAGALASAHAAGIVHNDVKPENILMRLDGEPALADFGIAVVADQRVSVDAGSAFTLAYGAPEVLQGDRATEVADVYGLASTMWTALMGAPPFAPRPEERQIAFVHRVATQPAPPLARSDAPATLVDVLAGALAKDPAQRPSAEGFGRQLQDVQQQLGLIVTELPITAGPDRSQIRQPTAVVPRPERHKVVVPAPAHPGVHGKRVAALSVAGLVVVIGAFVYWRFGGSSSSPSPSASPRTRVAASTAPGGTETGPTVPGSTTPTSTAPELPELPGPTNVKVSVSPTAADLSWQAPLVGRPAYAITVRPAPATIPAPVPAGRTSTTVTGLDTGHTAYCFVVSAVYLKRDGTAITANSAEVCTRPTPAVVSSAP